MKVKAKTHIEKMRERYASNRLFIRTEFGWSIEDYNSLLFETGCNFLEDIYPQADGDAEKQLYRIVSRCKEFWAWWRHEWAMNESFFMRKLADAELPESIRQQVYEQEMQMMIKCKAVENSYHNNLLKRIQHLFNHIKV